MRHLKFISIICFTFLMSFCKKETKIKSVHSIENSLKLNVIDTLIESIDSSKICNIQDNKQKIIELFFKSFQKDYNKPVINFNQVKNNYEKIEVKKYVDFTFNGKTFKTFLISFSYENDELYRSILLANTVLDDGLIIYEKVLDEGEYLRTSKFKKNIIINNLFKIEHFKYDKKGNISKQLANNDSIFILTRNYLIQENYIVEYYKESYKKINNEWGDKEIIYTKDGLDSSYIYLYKQRGEIRKNVKNGKWEERRYLEEYNKSVWMDGQYINGLKDGEWSYSPDGPVDKVEVYRMGKLTKTYFP
ncbi:hypothetical protein ABXT06_08715 [Flavobacterium sp. UW10123]|uniref:hypothetical protein n=1 Tax=Flavobacterium sp. UW10123 TaxID=3230800 RepID=UPI003398BA77